MEMETYLNTKEVIGRGAYKVVYKGIDRQKGIEVAWNELDVREVELSKVIMEIQILRDLDHVNVIHFYDSWLDEENLKLIFITELMTSGSLRGFLKTAIKVSLHVIKAWCLQILSGLEYLHRNNIIHRDIKLDNIFFTGEKGKVKIGDLGLATIMNQKDAPRSIIGTPEFMAPEFYDEKYDEKVDIWAFGMCIIEMITLEYPYKECTNVGSLYKTVSAGIMPQALALIKDPNVLEFICCCLEVDVKKRLSVKELQAHPFFEPSGEDEDEEKNYFVDLRTAQEVGKVLDSVGSPLTRVGWETWISSVITPVRKNRARKSLEEGRSSKEALSDQEQELVQPVTKNTTVEVDNPVEEIRPEITTKDKHNQNTRKWEKASTDRRAVRRSYPKADKEGNFSDEDEVLNDPEDYDEDVVLPDDVQSLIVSAPIRLPSRPLTVEDDRILEEDIHKDTDFVIPEFSFPVKSGVIPTTPVDVNHQNRTLTSASLPSNVGVGFHHPHEEPTHMGINTRQPIISPLLNSDVILETHFDPRSMPVVQEDSRNPSSPRISPRGRSVSAFVGQAIHTASNTNGSLSTSNKGQHSSLSTISATTVSKEDPPKKRKIDDLTSKNLLELQFTTTKTLKSSKPEFPTDWLMDQRLLNVDPHPPPSVTATVQGTTTPPLVTPATNPFLDPNVHSMGIHLPNPFLDHGQTIRQTPARISPRTMNSLAIGTMPFHTG